MTVGFALPGLVVATAAARLALLLLLSVVGRVVLCCHGSGLGV